MNLSLLSVPFFATNDPNGLNSGTPTTAAARNNTQLTAAGSSFVDPVMTQWAQAYGKDHQGLQINYQSIGSGGGIQQLKNGTVDFAASDAALDDEKLKEMPALVQIPESAGPVCITYNLKQLKEPLKLSAKTLRVFIRHDQELAGCCNQEGQSRSKSSQAGHRCGASYRRQRHHEHLHDLSCCPQPQMEKPGRSRPLRKLANRTWRQRERGRNGRGEADSRSNRVCGADFCRGEPSSSRAGPELGGQIREPDGCGNERCYRCVFRRAIERRAHANRQCSGVGAGCLSISGLTFLLVPKQAKDPNKAGEVKGFVQYIITGGQDPAEQLHYAKIPASLQQIDEQLLQQVQGGS